MKQKNLSNWLKWILAGICICGIIVYAFLVPALGKSIVTQYPEFAHRYYPWLGFIWATGIPCFTALYFGWRIASKIGQDLSFTNETAKYLKWISILAAFDAAFFFVGNIVLLLMNMNHPGIVIFSFFVVFIGIAISVAAAVLSHLVTKAAVLQVQSDFTI